MTKRQRNQIFVSYSRSDRLTVDRLYHDLRALRYRLWMDVDERGISPGEDWMRELREQMSASEGVVACVSPDFLRSTYCQDEIKQALAEQKPIYPVLVRRLDAGQSLADMGISHLQFVDLTQGYAEGVRRLKVVLPRPPLPLRWAALVLGVIVALLLVSLGASLISTAMNPPVPTTVPSLRAADVGIAVAYFILPEDGSVATAAADALIDQVAAQLQTEIDAFNEQSGLLLGVLPPHIVGRVSGETTAERAMSMHAIARQYDADIVLYGAIRSTTPGQLDVAPAFYVDSAGFAEALEVTGSFRLGSVIQVENAIDSLAGAIRINRALRDRTTAIAHIFGGITFYALENYEFALTEFEQAAQTPTWSEGREVLNILIGNTHMGLASEATQTSQIETARYQIDLAEQQYRMAQEADPSYSRPYTALASASYLKWNLKAQETGTFDLDLLRQAQDYLNAAAAADMQPGDVAVASKDLFAQVQVDFALFTYHASDLSAGEITTLTEDFERTANRIIQHYNDGQVSLRVVAAETYTLLGLAADDCTQAVEQYQHALELTTSAQRRMFLFGWLGGCQATLNNREGALASYQTALELAESAGDTAATVIEEYRQRMAELSGNS